MKNVVDKEYKEYLTQVMKEATVIVKDCKFPDTVIPVLVEKMARPLYYWKKEQLEREYA